MIISSTSTKHDTAMEVRRRARRDRVCSNEIAGTLNLTESMGADAWESSRILFKIPAVSAWTSLEKNYYSFTSEKLLNIKYSYMLKWYSCHEI